MSRLPTQAAPARLRLIGTLYPHWGAHAGIGQFARHLGPHGFAPEARLSPDDDSGLPLPGALAGRPLEAALRGALRRRVQRSGMGWYKLSDLAAELSALGAALGRRVDLIHFLDGEHGVQFLPRWLGRAPGARVPVVASFHQPPSLLPGLLDPRVLARLDAALVVAPTQEAFFREHLPAERVATILHGVDVAFFRPGPPRPEGPLRCVTVGHWLRDWAAMGETARALAADNDVELHVVTGRETGLEGMANVHLHRGLSDEALLALYRSCDLGLLPLTDSTANNSLLEMIACGLPVVTTGLAAVRAYVGPEEAVLLPDGNEGAAEAVLALRDDPARRARMGRAARARAEALAHPAVAAQHAALYRRVLSA